MVSYIQSQGERDKEKERRSYKVGCLGELIGSCFIVVED